MEKNLSFIDPICGKPGFHIDRVPCATDVVDYRRVDMVDGRAAVPHDPFICGSCGRSLLGTDKDAARLTDPLNYHQRAWALPGWMGYFAPARRQGKTAALQQLVKRGSFMGLDVIEDASMGPGEMKLVNHPAEIDPTDPRDTAEYSRQVRENAVVIAALRSQVKLMQASIEAEAKRGYDGMMAWKKTAEEKDDYLIKLQRELKLAQEAAKHANSDANMYANAWQRELVAFDGLIINKRHHIDAMVLTTRHLVDKAKQADKYAQALLATHCHIDGTLPAGAASEILRPFYDAGLLG